MRVAPPRAGISVILIYGGFICSALRVLTLLQSFQLHTCPKVRHRFTSMASEVAEMAEGSQRSETPDKGYCFNMRMPQFQLFVIPARCLMVIDRAQRWQTEEIHRPRLFMARTNPMNMVEKILRSKVYQNLFWKELRLEVETVVDKVELIWKFGQRHLPGVACSKLGRTTLSYSSC